DAEEWGAVALVPYLQAGLDVVAATHEQVHAAGHGTGPERRRHGDLDPRALRSSRRAAGEGEQQQEGGGTQLGSPEEGALVGPQTGRSASAAVALSARRDPGRPGRRAARSVRRPRACVADRRAGRTSGSRGAGTAGRWSRPVPRPRPRLNAGPAAARSPAA